MTDAVESPVRSYGTEADVLDRYRRAAAELGVEPTLAARIANEVIAAALTSIERAALHPEQGQSVALMEAGRRVCATPVPADLG